MFLLNKPGSPQAISISPKLPSDLYWICKTACNHAVASLSFPTHAQHVTRLERTSLTFQVAQPRNRHVVDPVTRFCRQGRRGGGACCGTGLGQGCCCLFGFVRCWGNWTCRFMIWRIRSALPVGRCEDCDGDGMRVYCSYSLLKDAQRALPHSIKGLVYHRPPMQPAVTNGETLHRTTFRHDISVLPHEERGKRYSNHRSPPNHSKTKLTSQSDVLNFVTPRQTMQCMG